MSELFNKKEINPTVRVVISMNQSEKNEFSEFSKKANIPLSALVRIAMKNFIKTEGAKYIND
jgi:predicted transcriptional regulator